MKGIVMSEQCHVVNILPPVLLDDTTTCDRFKMENYGHVTILIQLGVSSAAPDSIIVNEATAASGGSTSAIAFKYAAETTAAGDTLGSLTAATSAGITSVTANDNTMYVIEIDAQDLSDGSEWIEVVIAGGSPTPTTYVSASAWLSGSRYAGDQSATAIA